MYLKPHLSMSSVARKNGRSDCHATTESGRPMRNNVDSGMWSAGLVTALACAAVMGSGCSHAIGYSAYVSRPTPNGHVLLVPELRGGWSGWCVATGYRTATEGSSGCGEAATTFTGPIIDEAGCEESERAIQIYALTTSEVAAVSVYGGPPIPTRTNSTLPDGLRAAAVEVIRRDGHPNIKGGGALCPRLTPLDARGRPIRRMGRSGRPQAVGLPDRLHWEAPMRPSKGDCGLTVTRHSGEAVAIEGEVATRIRQTRPYRGLIDSARAFLSCVDTVYIYHKEHHLTSAVLLSESHPGATPPPLPGMKPLAGRPEIFEAPGVGGELAARRIPGAWLVVQGGDRIGLHVPLELLEDLHATLHL
jgi:hypothetical protein